MMKFTKKTLVSLLAFLLVLSSLTGFSLITDGFAADELKLITSVSTDTFSQGDTVTVTVSLDGSVSTKTGGLVLMTAYDHEAFEWVDGDFSESIRKDALLAITNPGKDAAFVYLNETAVTGEIFTFTLKATEKYTCGETYEIKAMPSNVLDAIPEGKTLVAGHAYENGCDSDCNVCGEKRSAAHDFSVKKQTGRLHWTECSLCGEIDEASRGAHVYDDVKDTLCEKCGYTRPIPAYVYAVHRGDEVTVTFTVSNAQAVTLRGLGLDLLDSYDAEVFEWVSGAWSKTVLDNAALHQVKPASEAVFASKKEFALSGEVFTVVLKVKEDAPLGDYDVVLGIRGNEVLQLSNAVVTVHECQPSDTAEGDAYGHWYPCRTEACTEKLNPTSHGYDNACDADCNICGQVRTVTHDYTVQDKDEDNHWMKCSVCGLIDETTRKAHDHDNACDADCNTCGQVRIITHDYTVQDKDEENHWMKCSVCGLIDETTRKAHEHDNACDTTCNVCGQERTVTHDYTVQDKDEENHWMKCSVCGLVDETTRKAHEHDNACDTTCNVCGQERTVTHDYTVQDKDEENHWMKCSVCGLVDETTRKAHDHDNACDTTCNTCGQIRTVPGHVYDGHDDLVCNECGYERPPYLPGDTDGDGDVDLDDAIYLLFHVNFQNSYPVNQPVDFDNSGEVDLDDAIYLLFHVNFKESYPLFPEA